MDKSLVITEQRQDELRYRLLETIRLYATEKLEQIGAADALRGRHRDWYLSLAERAESRIIGHDQLRWLSRLDREAANLRAAIQWSVERAEFEAAQRIGGALYWYWFVRGHCREGRELLEIALATSANVAASASAKALLGLCLLEWALGDRDAPAGRARESYALYRKIDDSSGMGWANTWLALVTMIVKKFGSAIALLREAGGYLSAAFAAASVVDYLQGIMDYPKNCLGGTDAQTS